jgi:hypothetical protein
MATISQTNAGRFRLVMDNLTKRGRCFKAGEGGETEICPDLRFHFEAWRNDLERCARAASLPLFHFALGQEDAPRGLASIAAKAPQDLVVYRDDVHTFDIVTSAATAMRHVAARLERARRGILSGREVAAQLARLGEYTHAEAWQQVTEAARLGRLKFFDLPGGIEIRPERLARHFGEHSAAYVLAEINGEAAAYTRAELVNQWLKQHSDGLQLPGSAVGAAPEPVEPADDLRKRNALIKELQRAWPSIEADLNDSSRNGLKAAAHARRHGMWNRDKALTWARQQGKVTSGTADSLSLYWSRPRR